MLYNLLAATAIAQVITLSTIFPSSEVNLASHSISLNKRYPQVGAVNQVFKDNILLNLNYLSGRKIENGPVDLKNLDQNTKIEFVLNPGESFAFHEDVPLDYQGRIVRTTNAHFNSVEGFISDGYLVGDGVCHLASLINWTASDAGLKVLSPTRHDFAVIPEIPSEYGTSIYFSPGQSASNQRQNLYITNNKPHPVVFRFSYNVDVLSLEVLERN